jgi:hypothetical protein
MHAIISFVTRSAVSTISSGKFSASIVVANSVFGVSYHFPPKARISSFDRGKCSGVTVSLYAKGLNSGGKNSPNLVSPD